MKERELSRLSEQLFPLMQDVHMLQFYSLEEWDSFFAVLGPILEKLLLLDPFGDTLALKEECREVLDSIKQKDKEQYRIYYAIVNKIFNLFTQNSIFPKKLPK